jgi:hypothetical protein
LLLLILHQGAIGILTVNLAHATDILIRFSSIFDIDRCLQVAKHGTKCSQGLQILLASLSEASRTAITLNFSLAVLVSESVNVQMER